MANNRLYAVCKNCNQYISLLKYYPDSWYKVNTAEIDDWFNEHSKCIKDEKGLQWGDNISFVTEIDDNKVRLYDFKNNKIFLK